MPNRRPVKKGSFGGHFDELVEQFRDEHPSADTDKPKRPRGPKSDKRNVHDRLFESAWRKAHGHRDHRHA